MSPGAEEGPDRKGHAGPRQTYLGNKVLLVGAGQDIGLGPAQFTLGEVGIHLVSIKVGVIGLAVGIVEPKDFLLGQDAGVVRLDGRSVQGGLSVQQENVPVLHVPAHLGQSVGQTVIGSNVNIITTIPGAHSAWPSVASHALFNQIRGNF